MAFTPIKKIITYGVRTCSSCIRLNDPYIISAVRTPIGCFQGKLSCLNAVQLGSKALTAAVEKSSIPKEDIQELILGCALPAGSGQGPARQIALFSGLPQCTIASTVNKLGASGMKAAMFGSQTILSNSQEVVAVCGAESLTNVPHILRRKRVRLGNICVPDLILLDALHDMFDQIDVAAFAEQTASQYSYSREDQDKYALKSYDRAAAALENGAFTEEIVPIILKKKGDEEETVCEDEQVKKLDAEEFKNLPPLMGKEGTVTAGNSYALSDGAAAMVLASGNYVLKKDLKPLARIVSFSDAAIDPKKFCIASSVAVPRALVRGCLTPDGVAMWEINETFAVVPMINTKILRIDPEKVNIHGGAISLGHPFGMTGLRIMVHLVHALSSGDFGCATVSHATGGASAVVIQKL